jgi:peptidoglycan hydrolase-like protein with peptidoglycan-binding domain
VKRCPSGEDDVKLWSVAVIAVAGITLVAGCGSGKVKNAAPTSSARQKTEPLPSSRTTTTEPTAHAKVSTASRTHRPALAWIRRLQRDLTKLHFYAGPITGVETPATKTAVIRFQRAAHLKPDGLWGAKSQAALDKMLHRHP